MSERNVLRVWVLVLTLALGSLASRPASAYCRATTCDPKAGDVCERDAQGCVIGSPPLFWPGSCVTFAVQRDGSGLNGITGAALEVAVNRAFQTWLNADCGSGTHPGIQVETLGLIECDQAEFNDHQANANDYMFRDSAWSVAPGVGDALGLTTAHFVRATGEIQDADVQINGTGGNVTNGDPQDGADLLSILTHESGHFLGLDHTLDASSVMFATYQPGVSNLRHLSADDTAGICALYPPQPTQTTSNDDCRPLNGFSGVCAASQGAPRGCSIALSRAHGAGIRSELFGVGLLLSLVILRAKSRPHRERSGRAPRRSGRAGHLSSLRDAFRESFGSPR